MGMLPGFGFCRVLGCVEIGFRIFRRVSGGFEEDWKGFAAPVLQRSSSAGSCWEHVL